MNQHTAAEAVLARPSLIDTTTPHRGRSIMNNESVPLELDDRSARLISGSGWAELTLLLTPYAKKLAGAVAFIGPDADRYLTPKQGSSMIVDASEGTVRAGLTDPSVLTVWKKRGVVVYSLTNLHAKLILAEAVDDDHPAFLAVGSANVSTASARRLREAVLLTDSDVTLDEARETIISWKSAAGSPLSFERLAELCDVYRADAGADPADDGDEGDPHAEDDESEGEHVTEWPKPTQIYVVPVGPKDDASEEALHKADSLAEEFGVGPPDDAEVGSFAIDMFWLDEDVDPDLRSGWTYPEGAWVIAVNGTKSGQIRGNSYLSEPGRIIYRFADPYASPPRTYYYLHVRVSGEDHTFAELKAALAAVSVQLDYEAGYLRTKVVDALLGIWGDIDYD